MLFIKKVGSSKKDYLFGFNNTPDRPPAGTHIHDIYLGKIKWWIIASIKSYYEKVC